MSSNDVQFENHYKRNKKLFIWAASLTLFFTGIIDRIHDIETAAHIKLKGSLVEEDFVMLFLVLTMI